MKQYPSIPGLSKAPLGKKGIAFYKYDGSNLRWEWSRKRGFYKTGTRTELLDPTNPILGGAVELFHDLYAKSISEVLKDIEKERAVVFTEYFGPSSFAGTHVPGDKMELKLFDVSLF